MLAISRRTVGRTLAVGMLTLVLAACKVVPDDGRPRPGPAPTPTPGPVATQTQSFSTTALVMSRGVLQAWPSSSLDVISTCLLSRQNGIQIVPVD